MFSSRLSRRYVRKQQNYFGVGQNDDDFRPSGYLLRRNLENRTLQSLLYLKENKYIDLPVLTCVYCFDFYGVLVNII